MNLGFLASGNGSNMQAIIDACREGRLQARPSIVISNNAGSGVLERARKEGITACHFSSTTHPDETQLDNTIAETLISHHVDLVILAGYMKRIGPKMLDAFQGRIINIHPALLPKFGGKGMYGIKVHAAVIAAGETETGVTIHIVDADYDKGPILAQRVVPVDQNDTPESLAARVLAVEHEIYVDTLKKVISGEIRMPQA
ncbi:MAG: phosphoribosylglycinamide formyltransferase [Gammaproteobacteria bacterium]